MLDERLTETEDNALTGEDVYDIHELFDDVSACMKFINKKTDIPLEEIQEQFIKAVNDYDYINGLCDYYDVYDEYIVFRTGRVARVEFY